MRRSLLFIVLAATLAGCGGPRQLTGDSDGVPVELTVTLSRNFVRDLKNRGPGGAETVVYQHFGPTFYHPYPYAYRGRYHGYGRGYYGDPFWSGGMWVSSPSPTTVHLLAGDGPAEGRLFRTELDYGDNRLIVPVKPGRKVVLTVQAYGGLDGWEEVGNFTADNRPGQHVVIDLKEHPPRIGVQDPPAPPMPPPPLPPPGASPVPPSQPPPPPPAP